MESVHHETPTEARGPASELIKALQGLEGGGNPGMGPGPGPPPWTVDLHAITTCPLRWSR